MRASTLFALTLSVIVGLVVAVGAKMAGFFNPPPATVQTVEPPKAKPPVMALVASRNIFANDLLEPAVVRLRALKPEELEHYEKNKDDYLPAAVQSVYLRVAAKNVTAETPLLKGDLKPMVKPETLDSRLVAQMRAVTVSLPKELSASGLIQVGDWVDVMLTSNIEPTSGNGAPTTRTACIVPRARVIAKRNTLWQIFHPLPEGQPVAFTLEVNPYRNALIEFARGKGQISLAPLPATDQRKLEGLRAGLLKDPARGNGIQFISADASEVSQEEARVETLLSGHGSVSEQDLIRIFGLQTPAPPETPKAPPQPTSIKRLTGTSHKDPLYFDGKGEIIAVGTKPVNQAPTPVAPDQSKVLATGTGAQFKFATPECATCKDKKAGGTPKKK